MTPIVSIIIPTYKHRDYVLKTLESVFTQTFTDFEVIVVNDGSPDDTAALLQPLAQAGRIKYIEQANQGQAAARNRGLAEAKGEFIAFLDDDDSWPPEKLEWQVEVLRENPDVGLVAGQAELVDEGGTPVEIRQLPTKPITFKSLFSGNPFHSPGQTLVRASLLRQVGGLNEQLWGLDDYDLWFKLSKCSKVSIRHQIALHYRIHSSNASNDYERMFSNCMEVIKTFIRHVPQAERSKPLKEAHRWLYFYLGQRLICEPALKTASSSQAARKFKYGLTFALPALRDRVLFRQMRRDILSKSAQMRLKALLLRKP